MSLNDPYQELGLPRTASEDDVRRAFRKLAKENHPDLNPGDRAAAERFKRISLAYEILGEPDKRRAFDRGEIDASGEPRRGFAGAGGARTGNGAGNASGNGGGFDFGFGDIFEEMFARERPANTGFNGDPRYRGDRRGFARRGSDVRYTLEVDFVESITGVRKRVTMPDGGTLDLAVPAGVSDGQVLRLRGKGAAGQQGGEAGDALVEVRIKPHPRFKRIADDIHSDAHITIDEALLGGKIEVTTIDGSVNLTLPKGTQQGRMFRLKGKGAKNPQTGVTGDQIVTIRVMLPIEIDEGLSYFLSEWRKSHTYDPGPR
ncbi:MAG: J domain-containing protein [Hyphomicrobiaceae bacterium]|nr:J domain-containing protein [Hyphomicrobiaceae bacterium]